MYRAHRLKMTARKIVTWPNEKLLKKAERIQAIDSQIKQLAQDLYDTMLVSFGVGLAATQVDEQWSMCIKKKSCLLIADDNKNDHLYSRCITSHGLIYPILIISKSKLI